MKEKRGIIDFPLFIVIIMLLCIGIVMVFSASMVADIQGPHQDSYYHLKRQVIWAAMGLVTMIVTINIPYTKYRNKKFIAMGMFITIALLLIVFAMPPIKGARRWIGFGGVGLQPSEVAKIMLIIYLSDNITRKGDKIKTFSKGMLPILIIAIFVAFLIILEPNMSTAVIIVSVAFCLLFAAGARFKHLFGLFLTGLVGIIGLAIVEPYRLKRITGFLDPWGDSLNTGYQAIQSLYALGSGGLFGLGLCQSRQKWYYIPEAQNDFIMSIIGEELGFIGVLFIIILFALLISRGLKIAINCKDKFGSLLATGITSLIAVQASINLLVVSSFMPVTGVTLPLISYGGSSLLFTMASLGILLNISRYSSSNKLD